MPELWVRDDPTALSGIVRFVKNAWVILSCLIERAGARVVLVGVPNALIITRVAVLRSISVSAIFHIDADQLLIILVSQTNDRSPGLHNLVFRLLVNVGKSMLDPTAVV